MKKLAMVGALGLMAVAAQAITIDGTLTAGEWDWANANKYSIGTAGSPNPIVGDVWLGIEQRAGAYYLCAAFDVTGYTPSTSPFGDMLSINVQTGDQQYPSGLSLMLSQSRNNALPYGETPSGSFADGNYALWRVSTVDNAWPSRQNSLPDDLNSFTRWESGDPQHRVTEMIIPLLTLGVGPGSTIRVFADVDYDSKTHWSPNLMEDWKDYSDYAQLNIPGGGGTPVPDGGATAALLGAALVGLAGLRRKMRL